MAASPKDSRYQRRLAAGDDVNKISLAPQPIPGAPQNQKAGNVMNNPMFDVDGQMSQKIGTERNSFTYGDMALATNDPRMGVVGIAPNSNRPQGMVKQRGQNAALDYNDPMASMPMGVMSEQEPVYMFAQAQGRTEPNGLNAGLPLSYIPSPMGPLGRSAQDPAVMPPNTQYVMPDSIPLNAGVQSAEAGALDRPQGKGMSTGRGGGRNKTA